MCNHSVTIWGKLCIEFNLNKNKVEKYEKTKFDCLDVDFCLIV